MPLTPPSLSTRPSGAIVDASPLPKVSVSLITYNQARFITQAIESVLAQETSFPVELVLSNDASTDETGAICRAYQKRFPDRIRLIDREVNIGLVPNYLGTFLSCKGEYVALLEGDDFWTDKHKLQRQVEFMDAHPEYTICCHNVTLVDEAGQGDKLLLTDIRETTTVADLCRGDYVATASCLLRNHVLESLPDWIYGLYACDWPLDILHAEKGKIHYMADAMAAYRVHNGGMWSRHTEADKLKLTLDAISVIDRSLGYQYTRHFLVAAQAVMSRLREAFPEQHASIVAEYAAGTYEALAIQCDSLATKYARLKAKHEKQSEDLRTAKQKCKELKSLEKRANLARAEKEQHKNRTWRKRLSLQIKKWFRARPAPPTPSVSTTAPTRDSTEGDVLKRS